MNFKHKLGYMFIGCLFTIAGYILASLGGGATHAQQEKQVIDEIVCRHLKVVNKQGKTVAHIKEHQLGGGEIRLYTTKGEDVVFITSSLGLGTVSVSAEEKTGKGSVAMSAGPTGASLWLTNSFGETVVSMIADDLLGGTGRLSVSDPNGSIVAQMRAEKMGNGIIQTRKGVWRTH